MCIRYVFLIDYWIFYSVVVCCWWMMLNFFFCIVLLKRSSIFFFSKINCHIGYCKGISSGDENYKKVWFRMKILKKTENFIIKKNVDFIFVQVKFLAIWVYHACLDVLYNFLMRDKSLLLTNVDLLFLWAYMVIMSS